MSGVKFQLNNKCHSVPDGWSIDNWSGRDVRLDNGTVIHAHGELHVLSGPSRVVRTFCGKDTLLGSLEAKRLDVGDRPIYEPPSLDHCCSYLFVTMEMAFILSAEMDSETQEWVLFGVDHLGNVTEF